MHIEHSARLTSAELGNLWNMYMANSMSVCMLKHFITTSEDPDTKDYLEQSQRLSQRIVKQVTELFQQGEVPLPIGFQDSDVNLHAPRLFSDSYYLEYLDMMLKLGCIFYSIMMPNTTRKDVRLFLTDVLKDALDLANQITNLRLEKGLYVRPPYIPAHQGGFVHKQSFFNGFMGNKRPLIGVEIAQIFANQQFNTIKTVLLVGFSQVCQSDKIRDYFIRGKQINMKQNKIFGDLLMKEDLPATFPTQFEVTTSTVAPYSDKLMLFHVTNLSSAKIRNFGDSIAVSPRHDLAAVYGRFFLETGNFAEDGGNLLIAHEWMEQPPHAVDRHKLAYSFE